MLEFKLIQALKPEIEAKLAPLGAQGWRVAAMAPLGNLAEQEYVIILERQKQ